MTHSLYQRSAFGDKMNVKMLLTAILVAAVVIVSTKAEEEGERRERIFAYYSTTSVTRLTTTTITGLATCLTTAVAAPPPVCQGRKNRRLTRINEENIVDVVLPNEVSLDGSMADKEVEVHQMEKREVPARDGKRLTIWSTNFTTLTITSTSTLALTTVTIQALCVYPGSAQACF